MPEQLSEHDAIRRIADTAPFIVWMTDSAGQCFYLNPEWTRFTHQEDTAGFGEGWLDMLHPDDRDAAAEQFAASWRHGKTVHLEYRLRLREQGYRWVVATGRPYLGRGNQPGGYVGSINLVAAADRHAPNYPHLTAREVEILELTAIGKTSSEIATILSISPRTVEFHMSGVMLKANTVNRVQAVVVAIRHALIKT